MNEEFITEALRNDRCIKAHQLLTRFEKELESELRRMGEEMVEARPDLFESDVEVGSKFKASWDSGTIVANVRDYFPMDRVKEDDSSKNLRVVIAVRWVDPLDWNEENVDGALCVACYKINYAVREDFLQVKEETRNGDWDVKTGEDQYANAPGTFYIPVDSGSELRNACDTLIEHFTEFGGGWGKPIHRVDLGK